MKVKRSRIEEEEKKKKPKKQKGLSKTILRIMIPPRMRVSMTIMTLLVLAMGTEPVMQVM